MLVVSAVCPADSSSGAAGRVSKDDVPGYCGCWYSDAMLPYKEVGGVMSL